MLNESKIYGSDPVTVKLMMGSDVLQSFLVPGLWSDEDVEVILGKHGAVVTEREGANTKQLIENSFLAKYKVRHAFRATPFQAARARHALALLRPFTPRPVSSPHSLFPPLIFSVSSLAPSAPQDHIFICPQTVTNNISSTIVRGQFVKGQSAKYLLPDAVIDYVYRNKLYGAIPAYPDNPVLKPKAKI